MQIQFLGGADEVGASGLLIEGGGCRIVVDAGVRMGAGAADPLPDLAPLGEGGVDAVLLTHAHLDHSGALPLVHGAFPRAPVVTTTATQALLRVLLLDAIKVMTLKGQREGEVPLYPLPAVEALLGRTRGVRFLEPVELCDGRARATFFPAGHILGAAAVGIETSEGRVLVTGDVSVADQLTVPGMPRPRFSPDVVVCESTYGGRLHASRRAEEARLATTVWDALYAGGKVLIPAFALGRAQEVLLVLRRALARDGAPPATVWADGMVRAVCDIYAGHPDYLTRTLRERAEKGRGLFYTADGRVRPVRRSDDREAIVAGGPAVVVASSGMLAGGASAWYAARLASQPDALIAITGYQDEEAPGRRLQEVAAGKTTTLALEGATVPVHCRVETYGLSAHADENELVGLISALRPRYVALVHGDGGARRSLAAALAAARFPDVFLPAAGDVLPIAATRRTVGRKRHGIADDRPLDAGGLSALAAHLRAHGPPGRTYGAQEIAERWYGSDGVPTDIGEVLRLLESGQAAFSSDPKRPFLFRAVDPALAATSSDSLPERDTAGRLEQNAALAAAREAFPAESGLHRVGAERDTWTLRLWFHFPLVAERRHEEALAALGERTGWELALHTETHLGALQQRIEKALPAGCTLTRTPSVFVDERRVCGEVSALPDAADQDALAADILGETGFSLELCVAAASTPVARQAYDDSGRMEQNLVLTEVDAAFADLPHRPLRKSFRNDHEGRFLELRFVSPEVGGRYADLIERLAYRTGWRVQVSVRVDQQAVLATFRALLPEDWQLAKNPGLDVPGRRVVLKLAAACDPGAWEDLTRELAERTGFDLAVAR